MNGDGREGGRRDDEVRGARRIPGPRGAVDDLDLETVERPVLPPPGASAPDEAVPEQGAPEEDGAAEEAGPADAVPEAGAAEEAEKAEKAVPEPDEPYEPDEPDQPEEPEEPAEPGPVQPHAVTAAAASAPVLSHRVLKALLGAWALSACSAEETAAVEDHLTGCAPCADEALRLRDAVGMLHTDGSLDLDPTLRTRVLDGCLGRRPARVPIPEWATAYDAETARLDALLRDIGDSDWHAPVRLQWFEDERAVTRRTTVAGVIGHLMAVDGLVSAALGLDDPLAGTGAAGTAEVNGGAEVPLSPTRRTETYWAATYPPATRAVREPWRALTHEVIRTASLAGRNVAERSVSYGEFALPLQDALLDRAFECWVHGTDIAEAVDYPYRPPSAAHLHRMIDLAARMLPAALAGRRGAGLAGPARELVAPGEPGRSVHLEVEGHGGGDWYIALDSPAAVGSRDRAVAQVALDGVEFCQLVAGHISPVEAAAGQEGDREAIRDVLFASASLSRL
ncbi:zf-HC2 domain-containing protein [Streptomyces cyaneofuscatus]|uniref:Zf-HC2 domain-containing protein n=1 Tax=Streptomyces cyaneofuscatus TaxID=66883 RepID=A0ABZ1EZK7_9ACTN|nr:zf-HC2 domain-containing protein [Streptomyces cyaneofuscatus]WSB09542.1 zf-HC2 domain-containing protein [Streptomyces cyaneofuscatus]WSD46923.1 zf-HC2 domain-containing protein [Streptomyces cyaneofuscatus]